MPLRSMGPEPNDDLEIDFDDLLADLNAPEPATGGHVIHLRPTLRALDNGSDPLLLIRELCGLGATVRTVDLAALPDLDSFEPDGAYICWEIDVPASVPRTMIEEIFDFIGEACGLSIHVHGEEPRFTDFTAKAVTPTAPEVWRPQTPLRKARNHLHPPRRLKSEKIR